MAEMGPGSRWRSVACTTEVIVVAAPTEVVSLHCGGHPMAPVSDQTESRPVDQTHSSGTVVGKRFRHDVSGLEVLCTKAGAGSLSIDGVPVPMKEAKPLPSSD
jgi:hypothetical protein